MAITFQATHDKFGIFSNFSRHPVVVHTEKGYYIFPTSEALYQALKFQEEVKWRSITGEVFLVDHMTYFYDPSRHLYYRPEGGSALLSPKRAKEAVYEYQELWYQDWKEERCIPAMQWVLSLKLMCHPREVTWIFDKYPHDDIIELSRFDHFWGVPLQNWSAGENMLGRCWMSVRNVYFDLVAAGYSAPTVIAPPRFTQFLGGAQILPIRSEDAQAVLYNCPFFRM